MISLLCAFITSARAQGWRSTAKMNDCVIRLPSKDDRWLEFDNYNNRERIFVVYADLECVLRKMESDKEDALSYTYQQHRRLA